MSRSLEDHPSPTSSQPASTPSNRWVEQLRVTKVTANELAARGYLNRETASELKQVIAKATIAALPPVSRTAPSAAQTSEDRARSVQRNAPPTRSGQVSFQEFMDSRTPHHLSRPPESESDVGDRTATHVEPAKGEQTLPARTVDSPDDPVGSVPSRLRRTLAEFLADHNIRWGELIAGALIIACSIGLVVSLWSTLRTVHRVIPSLVFLGANAAIFGAGFYTLFRWRLRETSRATLVIALLLVPLSILTGISVSGIDGTAVPMDDAITLISMAVAGCVYGWLIWNATRSLVGTRLARPVFLGYTATVFLPPFLPAATRWLGDASVLLLSFAVACVIVACRQIKRIQHRASATDANRSGLVLGILLGGLTMVVGYVGYTHSFSLQTALRLGAMILPAYLQLAASTFLCGRRNQRPVMTILGTASLLLTVVLGALAVFPSTLNASWFLMWVVSLSVSGMTLVFERDLRRIGLAMLAVVSALAVSAVSSMLAQQSGWDELGNWQRFVGGGPMVTATIIGLIALSISSIRETLRRPLGLVACSTFVLAGLNGLAVAIAPSLLLGAFGEMTLVGCSAVSGILLIHLSMQRAWKFPGEPFVRPALAAFSHGCLVIASVGIAREISAWNAAGLLSFWAGVAFASSFAGAILLETALRQRRIRHTLQITTCSFAGVAMVLAIMVGILQEQGSLSVGLLIGTTVVWAWTDMSRHSLSRLLSRVSLVVTLMVAGYVWIPSELYAIEGFRTGVSLWHWATLCWLVAICIKAEHHLSRIAQRRCREAVLWRRLARLQQESCRSSSILDRCGNGFHYPMQWLAYGVTMIAACFGYVRLLAGLDPPAFDVVDLVVPLMALLAITIFTSYRRPLRPIAIAGLLIWVSTILSTVCFDASSLQLLASTCFMIAGALLLRFVRGFESDSSAVVRLAFVVMFATSTRWMIESWWPNVVDGGAPSVGQSLCIASWWLLAVAYQVYLGWKTRDERWVLGSVLLGGLTSLLFLPGWYPGDPATWMLWIAVLVGFAGVSLRGTQAVGLSDAGWWITAAFCEAVTRLIASSLLMLAVLKIWLGFSIELDLVQIPAVLLTVLLFVWSLFGRGNRPTTRFEVFRSPGVAAFLASGQVALLVESAFPNVPASALLQSLCLCIAVATFLFDTRLINHWIAMILVVIVMVSCAASGAWGFALSPRGLAACVIAIGGPLLGEVTRRLRGSTEVLASAGRFLGFAFGSYFLASGFAAQGQDQVATILLGWFVLWQFALRLLSVLLNRTTSVSSADTTFGIAVIVVFELTLLLLGDPSSAPALWVGRVALILASTVMLFLPFGAYERKRWVLMLSLHNGIAALGLASMHLDRWTETGGLPGRMVVLMLAVSISLTALAFGLDRLQKWIRASTTFKTEFEWVVHRSLVLVGFAVCGAAILLVVTANAHEWTPLAVCSAALVGLSFGERGQRSGFGASRHAAVAIGMLCIGLVCSIGVIELERPWWQFSAKWFVGWVITAISLGFLPARLLRPTHYAAWRSAIRSGMIGSAVLAMVAMVMLFSCEILLRVSGQADDFPSIVVGAVAVMLAGLTAASTCAALMSAPGRSMQSNWRLSDRTRIGLILSAQFAGGLTWFHLFLCKSPLASLGLRAYWPYVVMVLAFLSVGLHEWAKKTKDDVLARQLQSTAFLLPLVPVLGFWLSGSWVTNLFGASDATPWSFIGGQVSYQALLAIATVFYGVTSLLNRSKASQIASIVLGNGFIWVLLSQMPGWSLLIHPQAWMIPAALSALVATHLHRDSLDDRFVAASRYVCTLTIYLSSTADMMIQGIADT
ncbi:MAG: hypothetical protein AAGJ83_01140, partial [Planctomycetota bacterium]